MKEKGFTLIELLAVIVILAIIALIATPIILGIINDAKKESDKRSIELYGKAIENYVAKSQLDGTEIPSGNLDSTFLSKVEYDGSRVVCTTTRLNTDGTVHLSGCTVGGKEVDYTYGSEGTDEDETNNSTLYYSYDLSGTVNTTAVPAQPSTTKPTGTSIYIGYNISNDVVSEAYVCFIRDSKEYCLKGYDTGAYSDNVDAIREAFADIADTNACSFADNYSYCSIDNWYATADSSGYVNAYDDVAYCVVNNSGDFRCE